jgi:hypothetical protein
VVAQGRATLQRNPIVKSDVGMARRIGRIHTCGWLVHCGVCIGPAGAPRNG